MLVRMGLLYCGKCHTPKQTRLPFNPLTGDKVETVVRAVCQCQREADEEAERRAVRERFQMDMGAAPRGRPLLPGWAPIHLCPG